MIKIQNGYIALISVILISAIILTATIETSYAAFFSRFNILNSENKEESLELAKSCIQVVLVRLAENPDYQAASSGDNIFIEGDRCQIMSVNRNSSDNLSVKTQANFSGAITNLEVTMELTNDSISVESIREAL